MAKIKTERQDDIISGHSNKPLIIDHVLFSFKYMNTKNKKYSFNYFKDNIRQSHEAYEALFKKMNEISLITTIELLLGLRKKNGCETVSYNSFNPSMQAT